MKPEVSRFGRRASIVAAPLLATVVAFTGLGLSSGVLLAQKSKDPDKKFEDFDRNNFDRDRSTSIDNKWLPLKPGTRYVFKGSTQEGKKRVPHRLVMTVTDLTKVIDGVRTVVMWDVDFKAEKLAEAELAFYAQDKGGNVWYLGEFGRDLRRWRMEGSPSLVGRHGRCESGIKMQAEPRPGTPSYSQGYSPPPYKWTDRGKVDQVGQKTCVPAGCYQDVLVIAKSSEEEGKEAQQLKYHAPGVGYVRVGWRGKGEKTKETLELAEIITLGPEALAKVRADALELEKRAYIMVARRLRSPCLAQNKL